jgi:N-acetylneuraminic acid mutarotase
MLDDLYRLDLSTMAWERLTPGGTTPHARCSSAFAAVPGARILYFGGAFYGASGGLEMLGDAHVYDTQANAWLVPAVEGNLPAARNAGVMVPLPQRQAGDGAKLLLSGGWKAFVETFNDSFLVQLAP